MSSVRSISIDFCCHRMQESLAELWLCRWIR